MVVSAPTLKTKSLRLTGSGKLSLTNAVRSNPTQATLPRIARPPPTQERQTLQTQRHPAQTSQFSNERVMIPVQTPVGYQRADLVKTVMLGVEGDKKLEFGLRPFRHGAARNK